MKESVCAALILCLFWAGLALLALPVSPAPGNPGIGAGSETASEIRETAASAAEEAEASEERALQASAREKAGGRAAESAGEAAGAAAFDRSFRLPVLRDGQVVSMDLHSYLTGVLLGEIPAGFAPEAAKAQAVASRTYALYSYGSRRHGTAAVCTDSGCCQCWRDPETADPEALAAAEAAVDRTDGLVVCYGGALIEATFFSCSGGRTEDAAAVWGADLPYLRAVDSPGEEEAAWYTDELRIPAEDFCRILREADPEADFPAAKGAWVGAVSRTPGGGVDRIELGGRSFTGTRVRKLFGLRSTVFEIRLTEDEAIFSTRGYGHRVGMSQYGAQAMAEAGAGFDEILEHYYQGVEIRSADEIF